MDIDNQYDDDEETLLEIFGAEDLEDAEEAYTSGKLWFCLARFELALVLLKASWKK